ncbi:MAG: hypothetical protein EOP47_11400 [Sphingobacteriaceae bacterium]|nr:MAG: hypothetical protein EOP47_11400 [Sphingobacteriaceae bacterium]
MNIEYSRAYENLYADYVYDERRMIYPYFRYEYDLIRTIMRAIDQNSKGLINFRPDAAYFLLVNFHQMIVRPLLEVRTYTKFIGNESELNQLINDDIKTIIQTAVNKATPDNEITGHAVMEAINNLWRQLRTTKLEIWG